MIPTWILIGAAFLKRVVVVILIFVTHSDAYNTLAVVLFLDWLPISARKLTMP